MMDSDTGPGPQEIDEDIGTALAAWRYPIFRVSDRFLYFPLSIY
jgi:hypothetical protein